MKITTSWRRLKTSQMLPWSVMTTNNSRPTKMSNLDVAVSSFWQPRILQVDGMDDSIKEVAEKAHIGLLEEDSESIKSVSVKYKISVKEKKSVQEVEHDLGRDTWDTWPDFSSFEVKEEMGNFSVEVDCVRREYPKDFNVAWAVSLLTSLPWPPGYTVISSLPPSYHRE